MTPCQVHGDILIALLVCRAVFIFNLQINFINFLGIALTIAGGAFYSYVEYSSKAKTATSSLSNGAGSAAVDEKLKLTNRERII